jgi:DNA replication protein DnaC
MNRYKDADAKKCSKVLMDAIEQCVKEEKGIFVYGDTGVGKTYFLYALKNIIGGSVENFVSLLTEYRDYMQKGYYFDRMIDLTNKEYLLIDDIGAEKNSDFVQEFLYTVINKRYENMNRTVLTTNLSLDEFKERYGARILSRIAEMCVLVELKGEDRRLN